MKRKEREISGENKMDQSGEIVEWQLEKLLFHARENKFAISGQKRTIDISSPRPRNTCKVARCKRRE
jgi:hypothetical protein